ncbi:WD40/YVTN/BNR-like repeat-containing protein [Pseudomonas citronellolis]|uniref:WD40/YVTN/BNR-like repeat-containing protein n=1 Tax=Pseudomonas citronellolis TaxID=53408 RepID=UPI000852E184|nr:YCF48-related protein [Pseudomonas humi]
MRCIVLSRRVMLVLAFLIWNPANAHDSAVQEPMTRSAVQARLPLGTVLLDVTHAGKRLVAVGERGIVLLSDDDGATWRQAKVPSSVTLTRVRFATPMAGWATGHYGTVLHTRDGGETWEQQLDGLQAAQSILAASRASLQSAPDDSTAKRNLLSAERLVQDGPDKPFLDLYFFDDQHGIVVGAFNLIFDTVDGGKTWRSLRDRLDNPRELHLYAIAGAGDNLYIAGEQGVVFRSNDQGRTFSRVNTPYSGSYFSASVPRPGEILLAGLRGNVFRSVDAGETWEKVKGAPPVSFSAITRLADGSTLLANNAGQLFVSRGALLERLPVSQLPPLAAVLQLSDDSLLGVGVRGMTKVSLSRQGGN